MNDHTHELLNLIAAKWKDSYLLSLAIKDHIHEIQVIDDAFKEAKNKRSKNSANELEASLDNELMDLFILLSMWSIDNEELMRARLDKFMSKLETKKP